jgi:hypothetical protein
VCSGWLQSFRRMRSRCRADRVDFVCTGRDALCVVSWGMRIGAADPVFGIAHNHVKKYEEKDDENGQHGDGVPSTKVVYQLTN